LLQTLAVIGTASPVCLLTRVVNEPEAALRHRLSSLRMAEFAYERPGGPALAYVFKHVLTQDVVYSSVAGERLQSGQARTTQAIKALYALRLKDHYGEFAHHFCCSGHTEKAVCYQRGGDRRSTVRPIRRRSPS
jgi:hypothetical protein